MTQFLGFAHPVPCWLLVPLERINAAAIRRVDPLGIGDGLHDVNKDWCLAAGEIVQVVRAVVR